MSFHSLSYLSTVRSKELGIGLIELGTGLIELGIGLRIHVSLSFHSLSYSSTVKSIDLGIGLIELGIGLRIDNAGGSLGQTLGGKKRSSVVNPLLMLYMVLDIIRAIKQKNRLGNIAFIVYK